MDLNELREYLSLPPDYPEENQCLDEYLSQLPDKLQVPNREETEALLGIPSSWMDDIDTSILVKDIS